MKLSLRICLCISECNVIYGMRSFDINFLLFFLRCDPTRAAKDPEPPAYCCCCTAAACPTLHATMGCFLRKFDNFLNRSFYQLGLIIANHYGYFIIVPIFITAILATGFQNIHYEDDPEYLFSPTTGVARNERAIIEQHFFLNFSSDFHPSRVTRTGRFARLIIMAKDGGSILRSEVWNDIHRLDQMVHEVAVKNEEGRTLRYDNLCAIWDSKCYENTLLDLHELMPEVENKTYNLTYPLMLNPATFETYVFPHYLGGVNVTDDNVLLSTQALSLFYWLKNNTPKEDSE